MLALALSGQPGGRPEAQRWLLDQGYQPSRLTIPAATRLGGRMFRANVAFDDHPPDLRWSDRIDTVSVESIDAFLTARGARRIQVRL